MDDFLPCSNTALNFGCLDGSNPYRKVEYSVLSSFGIALLVGILIEKISEVSFKNIKKGILFVF